MAGLEEEERALLSEESPPDQQDVPPARKPLSAICDPQRLAHRLVVLALMCFLGFGERARQDPAGVACWRLGRND